MRITKNISLKNFNTFGIDVKADNFIEVTSVNELLAAIKGEKDFFLLGGGSNMLLTKDVQKTVLHLNIKGIKISKENKYSVYIEVNAGENWHKFVLWSLKNDFGGIENLSLIPGNVGTCPIQNIGAYGVEVKDTIHQVNTIEIKTGKKVVFKNSECQFGYRNSIFKNSIKGKYIITSVVFKLTKIRHKLQYNYGAIQTELENNKINKPTIQNISKAIIKIRNEKLPDPKKIGNSGSFFKNPVVNKSLFLKAQAKNPNMPFYLVDNEQYKIPAGWLIEQSGFKGKRYGDAGVHENQALVLVNYNNATGNDILNLAKKIQEKVNELFSIELEMEVNIF
ncbi:MAG TPA: UDP-N-acetylmuramate dehydrogenase, partial [Flavobacteriaceae bacterium]|nr:UDP-N-acetylmuramate dehydrogenase [Flavobacteriaceae bacterium]